MGRKILFGLIYTVVLYFFLLIVGGAVVGGIAGFEAGNGGGNPTEAGRVAGLAFGESYRLPIFIFSLILSAVGCATSFLPGTRRKKGSSTSP